ncbi:MAG: uroporphyrinogen-III synthase [Rhizobiaceae bacterium]
MHILITRPEMQAKKTAESLQRRGHSFTIEPLLEINPIRSPMPPGQFDALIVTSINALPTLDSNWPKDNRATVPLLATGAATANAARKLGFKNSQHVPGTVAASSVDLTEAVPAWMTQNNLSDSAHLLYPSAETVAHDVVELLANKAISCHRWTVYRASPATQFTDPTKTALNRGEIDAVLLYSKRTAHTFVQLMRKAEIPMNGLRAYVLSLDILETLPKEMKSHARSANQPDEDSLLDLIDA